MNVKRIAVAGVVIERRRQLDVNVVRESKPRACLPRQHERVGCRNFLACLITVARTDDWIRPYRILGVLIVIHVLCGVHEDVQLKFEWLAGLRCYHAFSFLAVASFAIRLNGFTAATANIESKRVLILFREAFRIDVIVPQHRRRYERLRHSASRKLEVRETGVTEIRLAYEDSVVAFCEWTARRFAAESHVG